MSLIVTRRRIVAAFIAALISILLIFHLPILAEPQSLEPDDTHQLLEKSLSVVEIDKEIGRIQEQKQALILQLSESEQQLIAHEQQISDKREQAGRILRAYYMGERDFLWSALLSINSLPDLFRIIDYIDIIFSHDKHTLNAYLEQYRSLKEGYAKLEKRETELSAIEEKLNEQRSRVIALEQQLAEQLDGRSDAERIRLLIKELTSFWESVGNKEVNTYFRALSLAMQKLPDWVQDNKHLLEIKGLQYTLRVPEAELNKFLREQDELFNDFSFQFTNNQVTAKGKNEQIEISVSGHYSVENEPVNGIIFHVDELIFNGFSLPDTTRAQFEEEFDLGFYPQLIIPFLRAQSVEMNDGELVIVLQIKL